MLTEYGRLSGHACPEQVPAGRAFDAIPVGSTIAVSPSCGVPTSLLSALATRSQGREWTLLSGLIFDPSELLTAVGDEGLRWKTWHPTAACQERLAAGLIQYVPLRASQVPKQLPRWGTDVALVRVTPPDRHGWCSLGPSVSYALAAVQTATLTIAEVDPSMPRTWGQSMIHASQIQIFCESTAPMAVYEPARPDDTSRAIAGHLIDLLPERPVLQMGIGRIPESLVTELAVRGVGGLRFTGMGCDGMVDLAEKGLLDLSLEGGPAITSPDLLGSSTLMRFADDNPTVAVYPSSVAHDPIRLGGVKRFVSVNSAVQVDLAGQVNAEMVNGKQISGVGGSLDFFEAATHSPGGLRVIALPAARIVPQLGEGSVVTASRSVVDTVVTERGVARLEGLTERERAEALASIAGDTL